VVRPRSTRTAAANGAPFRPSIRQLNDFQGLGKGRGGIAILIRLAVFRPVDRQKQLSKSGF